MKLETLSPLQRNLAGLALFAGVLVADQLTKYVVESSLVIGQSYQPIPALAPFFQIVRSTNTGAAFGLLSGFGDIFLILAVVVVIGMAIWYPRIPAEGHWRRVAVALISAGAIGNALDRIEYGHVVDFIYYSIPGVVANVSNLADHAIVGGVIILMIATWQADRQQAKGQTGAAPVEVGSPPDERPVT